MNHPNLPVIDYFRCAPTAVAPPSPSLWLLISIIVVIWLVWVAVIASIAKMIEYIFDELLPENEGSEDGT